MAANYYLGNLNGCADRYIGGFNGVNGGYGVGQKNVIRVLSGEGIMHVNYNYKRNVTFRI